MNVENYHRRFGRLVSALHGPGSQVRFNAVCDAANRLKEAFYAPENRATAERQAAEHRAIRNANKMYGTTSAMYEAGLL